MERYLWTHHCAFLVKSDMYDVAVMYDKNTRLSGIMVTITKVGGIDGDWTKLDKLCCM